MDDKLHSKSNSARSGAIFYIYINVDKSGNSICFHDNDRLSEDNLVRQKLCNNRYNHKYNININKYNKITNNKYNNKYNINIHINLNAIVT